MLVSLLNALQELAQYQIECEIESSEVVEEELVYDGNNALFT